MAGETGTTLWFIVALFCGQPEHGPEMCTESISFYAPRYHTIQGYTGDEVTDYLCQSFATSSRVDMLNVHAGTYKEHANSSLPFKLEVKAAYCEIALPLLARRHEGMAQ